MSRALAREDAFKLIFEMGITEVSAQDAVSYLCETIDNANEMWSQKFISSTNRKYINEITTGIEEKKEVLNSKIEPLLKGWSINRISKVDLAILQLAFYEIEYIDDIPYKVSANEAVKLAKKYGGTGSGAFVNGIIGTLLESKDTEGN